ncbi:MAG: TetR/AcrR family transcriptional regulator [Solirubrobacteraceae bacterium]
MPPAERREQLLDATLELITRERSFEPVSMEAVAREAGVTKPVVYDLFANRTILLSALIQREERHTLHELAGAIPQGPWLEADPDDVLVDAVATFLDAVQRNPRRWLLVLHPLEGTPSEIRDKVEEIREGLVQLVTELVTIGLAVRRTPGDPDVDLLTRMLIGNAEEGARMLLTKPDEYPPERLLGFIRWWISVVPREAPHPASLATAIGGPIDLGDLDPARGDRDDA